MYMEIRQKEQNYVFLILKTAQVNTSHIKHC